MQIFPSSGAILRGGLWLLKRSHFRKSISFIIQVMFSSAYRTIFKCDVGPRTAGLEVNAESNLHPASLNLFLCDVSFVSRHWGQNGQTPASQRRETAPLMICRSSRLIGPHTSVDLPPLSLTYLFIFLFNMSANGIKNMLPWGLCNLENKSIKFINLIMGNNNE